MFISLLEPASSPIMLYKGGVGHELNDYLPLFDPFGCQKHSATPCSQHKENDCTDCVGIFHLAWPADYFRLCWWLLWGVTPWRFGLHCLLTKCVQRSLLEGKCILL